ncbi:MAG TPA: hypothetical protein VMV69_10410 [Pirellulales bacterium]|nr:hypothetical protein [Pirellulales bacterium]
MSSANQSRLIPDAGGEKSRPLFTKRVWTGTGSVEVAVFDRMVKGDDGEFRVFNIVAKRSWKSEDGYDSSNNFRPEDLLPLALFLQLAYEFIANEQARK